MSSNDKVPRSVFFIIGNEICERFSFYGLKAILALYMVNNLSFTESTATASLHAFVMVAYSLTLFGGILSDSYLGKFHTILYLSIVYVIGGVCLSVTAIPGFTGDPPSWWGLALSLTLIAIGTGGIKPVISSFLGDQFTANQERLITKIFMYFYFGINLGSVFSTFITPIVRTNFSYAAAFGLPSALLTVATVIFVIGKQRYRRIAPAGSVVVRSLKAIWFGFSRFVARRLRCEPSNGQHWLDCAVPLFGAAVVSDVKSALNASLLFVPMPFFWALFDQHQSRWIFQAKKMDRELFGLHLDPDQIPLLNPLLVLVLIPLFDYAIYPCARSCRGGNALKPLTRMIVGMLLITLAFVMAAVVEGWINASDPGSISVVWQFPQYLLLTTGEVLTSITGLEFAYTQSPPSLKAFVGSLWQLSVAGGNLIVIIVASSNLLPQFYEYLLFAALMFVSMSIFGLIARQYKYRDDSEVKAQDSTDDGNNDEARLLSGDNQDN